MRIAIASDHAAVALKAELVAWLREIGHEVNDLGPAGIESVDYPDYGYKLAEEIAAGTRGFRRRPVRLRHRHLDRGQSPSGLPRCARFPSRSPPAWPASIMTPTSSPWARA